MSVLTDRDIEKELNRNIIISPCSKDSITAVGYDLRVGEFVYSLEKGLLNPVNGIYNIPPHCTVQILTKEAVWISNRIAATIHSKVSIISHGISHISTTIDPGWSLPLLLTIRNNTDSYYSICEGKPIATVVFQTVKTRTKKTHENPGFLREILGDQIQNTVTKDVKSLLTAYHHRARFIFTDEETLSAFYSKIEVASRSMTERITIAVKQSRRNLRFRWAWYLTPIVLTLVAIQFFEPLFEFIREFFVTTLPSSESDKAGNIKDGITIALIAGIVLLYLKTFLPRD